MAPSGADASQSVVPSWRRALLCLRVRSWWYFALLPAAGFDPSDSTTAFETLAGVFAASGCLGFAYGLNSITDAGLDRSSSKNPFAGGARPPWRARLLVAACACLALVIALLRPGARALPATVASLVVAFSYSAPPRLKAVPFVGTVLNAGIFAPLFWLGAPLESAALPTVVLFTGLLLQNQLLHELEDRDEDLAAGVVTTAAILGARRSRGAAVAIGAAAALGVQMLGKSAMLAGACIGLASIALVRQRARRLHRVLAALSGGLFHLITVWVLP